jgi:hypothetical protein
METHPSFGKTMISALLKASFSAFSLKEISSLFKGAQFLYSTDGISGEWDCSIIT